MRVAAVSLFVSTPCFVFAQAAYAQQAADRIDSTLVAREQKQPAETRSEPAVPVEVAVAHVAPATDKTVFVGAVSISGLQVLSPADFSDIIARRVGQSLAPDELATLLDEIADRMHARGYAFASAWIEPQRLSNGVLAVHADEGRIDEVRFDGPVPDAVRRSLAPLVDGQPARMATVEWRLLIAGDVDGVQIRSTRFVRENGRGVLLVRVTQDRAALRVAVSNQGTKPIGPEQIRIDGTLNGLLASDDSLLLSYSTTPAQPRELQFGYLRYARRLNAEGTELALNGLISVTHPGAYLTPFRLRNRSWYASVSLLQPLQRQRGASFWLEGEFGIRNLAQWRDDLRARRDQVVTARLTFYGNGKLAGGRLRLSTTLTQGLGMFGATEAGDLLASRLDADGTFTSVNAWADWTHDLAGKLSLRLAVQGQVASQPLLIGDETSLGGTAFLRGYDWGERTGDEGVMGLAELRYLLDHPLGIAKRAQMYAFVDGGRVSNLNGGFGGGSLASAGGGMRMDFTSSMGATLELAVPLSGARYDTGKANPKLNFSLVKSF